MSQTKTEEIHLGISSCLLGEAVRYDGGHKRDPFIVEQLSKHFVFDPICPEVAIGLGVPRPPIRLVGTADNFHVLGVEDSSLDVTHRLEQFAISCCDKLAKINGYILKQDSPSCGLQRVKIYPPNGGRAVRKGSGGFARILKKHYPLLPMEEEGRLNDPVLRENFINRVYIYHRWQQLCRQGLTPTMLIAFHSQHKYLVAAHSQAACQRLGRLLSNMQNAQIKGIAQAYITDLMTACKRTVSRKRHVKVLQHIMGYLKRNSGSHVQAELAASIEAYRRGETALAVPITLLRHHFRLHPGPNITEQFYLYPHPDSLGLRNRL